MPTSYVPNVWVNGDRTKPLSESRLGHGETQAETAYNDVLEAIADPDSDIGGALSTKIVDEVGTTVPPVVAQAIAADGTVVAAAAAAVTSALEEENIATGEDSETDEFYVRFDDGDPFLRANEDLGLTSTKIEGAELLALQGSGYVGGVFARDGSVIRAVWAIREDGLVVAEHAPPTSGPNICWPADSMGGDTTGASLAGELSALARRVVYKGSVGGETSYDIACRHGSNPLFATIAGGSIPASGPVSITLKNSDGVTTVTFIKNGDVGLNPVTLRLPGGVTVVGVIAWTGSAYTFTRATPGSVISVARPVPVISAWATERAHDITIIQIGRNNSMETSRVKQDILAMVNHLDVGLPRYLVLGLTPEETEVAGSPSYTALMTLKAWQQETFGRRYVDLHRYLVEYGLAEAGITPTTQDLADIANDVIPVSLRRDNLHFNATAIHLVAKYVHDRLTEMGWL